MTDKIETTKRRIAAKHKKILRYVAKKAEEFNIKPPTGGKTPRRDRKNLSKMLRMLRGESKRTRGKPKNHVDDKLLSDISKIMSGDSNTNASNASNASKI